MKSKKILQADQMLITLNKQWATIQDIMLVGSPWAQSGVLEVLVL